MAQTKPFKVIIIGGSVTGLSLANMLQAHNIDYVLLEAWSEIAPQVGASIGLLPHGNRILDQLGVFDTIMSLSTPVDTFTFRNDTGAPLSACRGVNRSFVQRHGFPIVFLDRQTVLQVLYENIKDKSKIMTNKRVTSVTLQTDGATVFVNDGSSYTGDIVIGGDGVHSTIRDEILKLAGKLEPGAFDPAEETEVGCDYKCIFGISSSCPGVNPGDMNSCFRDKVSYLIIGGPLGRTYWFRFEKNPKKLYGSEIPRYTAEDEAQTIKDALNEQVINDVKFSTLIKNKISSSMTPLVEHVYKRWYFRRVMLIGDSAHKFHPIGGHGGNGAIETAATFTNLIVEAIKNSSSGHPSTSEIEEVFRRVQEIRRERTIKVMKYSHDQQRMESLDTFFRKIIATYILPLVDDEDVTYNFSCQIPEGEKLDNLPVKRGERLILYKDDLLSEPKSRGLYQWLLIAFYVGVAAVVYYGMWVLPEAWNLIPQMESILINGTYEHDSSFTLLRSYTGIDSLDQFLVFLAVIFMPGLRAWSTTFRLIQVYFLGMLTQPIAIWSVEAFRKRNALTIISIPSLWFALFQTTGIGVYMPLYYAAYTFITNVEPYWWPLKRIVPIHYAKNLLAASLIGYALPTLLMFIPWGSSAMAQYTETIWQPSPLYVPILTSILGLVYYYSYPPKPEDKLTPIAKDTPPDVAYLKQVYLVTGLLGAVVHWGFVLYLLATPSVSFADVFVPDFTPTSKPLADGLQNIFLVDFWGFVAASYVWCVMSAWDLNRVGRSNVDLITAALVIFAAHFLLGPGSAMSAVWYWREEIMAIRLFPQVGNRKLHRD